MNKLPLLRIIQLNLYDVVKDTSPGAGVCALSYYFLSMDTEEEEDNNVMIIFMICFIASHYLFEVFFLLMLHKYAVGLQSMAPPR